MRIRLLIVFLLIVLLPIVGISWLALKTMRDESDIVRHRFDDLLTQKLKATDTQIASLLRRNERVLYKFYNHSDYAEVALRRIVRDNPTISQLLVLNSAGLRIFPLTATNDPAEREFIQRSQQFVNLFIRDPKFNRALSTENVTIEKTRQGIFVQQKFANMQSKTADSYANSIAQQQQDILLSQKDDNFDRKAEEQQAKRGINLRAHKQKEIVTADKTLALRDLARSDEEPMAKTESRVMQNQKSFKISEKKEAKKLAPVVAESTPATQKTIGATRSISMDLNTAPSVGTLAPTGEPSNRNQPQAENPFDAEYKGWSIWFWDNEINLLYSYRNRQGFLIATEISRTKLISDIIGLLPATVTENGENDDALMTLTDVRGNVIYKWGTYTPVATTAPLKSIALSLPLNAWTLNYYSSGLPVKTLSGYLPVLLAMITLVMALIGLAFYFYRENNRDLRIAQQRVSFVNQVSHELKTPLTNIRMYAELLEQDIGDGALAIDGANENSQAQKRIQIIVSESQRLSRLINNVLNFARKQRGRMKLAKSLNSIDDIIESVLQQFRPSLLKHKITIEFMRGASIPVHVDPDILEQILHNLINNVEKYALSGRYLEIQSKLVGTTSALICVSDHGPGIPKNIAEKVFEAFYRIDNKLTEGVTGTGIGLSISRDLAQLHGGNLKLDPSDKGAHFVLTLDVSKDLK